MRIGVPDFADWFLQRVQDAGGVRKLAEATSIPVQTLYQIKKGSFPKPDTLIKLGIDLQVPRVSA